MNVCYYITKNSEMIKNTKKSEVGDFVAGERIIAIDTSWPVIIDSKDLEGPFYDLKGLRENSKVYKELQKKNPRRAHKIMLLENIKTPEGFILSPKGQTYEMEFAKGFVHSVFGNFDDNEVKGIHFYDSTKVKIIEILETNSKGVWKAMIEAYDSRTEKWKIKEKPSSFFPKEWDRTTLLDELNFAYKNKTLKIDTNNIFESITRSGVGVVFVIENEKLKTIYPVL